ncbi:GldG family protein [Oleiagrimonas citrea]|uniref:ABC transporter n=1 Tax=Oleiagrimonas citrea TaxID=1665687 RepID=A0A846ZGH0_9GAMM|nr:Gldg family protein [Oleiagrimonas citrea]NKZ37885.1 ABC transporter [Oleiagrimonas citrea]
MRTLVRRSFLLRLGLLALLAAFVGVIFANAMWLRGVRVDLTSDHLYSLSPGTQKIIEGLHRPVHLTLYFSRHATRDLPQLRSYEQRVRELLQEMVSRSHGRLHLSVVDPVPYSDDEDRALGGGLTAMPGGSNGERVFFGLAGRTASGTELSIPFFDPGQEAFLEYNITRLVYELDAPSKPRIGILSTLPIDGSAISGTPPWAVMRQLHQLFDVHMLDPNDPSQINDKLSVLMIVHPKNLSDDELYAIDQYVMHGGHLAVFVDPDAEMDALPVGSLAGTVAGSSSDLPRLFRAWGVEFDPNRVVLDRSLSLSISLGGNSAPVRDFAVLGLGAQELNHRDVITASLQNIDVSSSGYFELVRHTNSRLFPLVQTSGEAMPVSADRVRDTADPTELYKDYRPTGEHYVIAARLRGQFQSAFPNRTGPHHLDRMREPGQVILVADTDLLSDRLWVRRTPFLGEQLLSAFANNGDFVANILDNLGGSSALLSVRGHAISQRPFTRVQGLRRAADVKFHNREKALEDELAATEQELAKLQPDKSGTAAPDNKVKQQLEKALKRKLSIRRQLREVQHQLDAEIDTLGTRVKAFNILLMPLLVMLFGMLYGWLRQRRSGKRDAT